MVSSKKAISLIMFFCIVFFIHLTLPVNLISVSAETKTQYAKIVSSNVKLYRSISGAEDYSNVFFILPKSYFVILDRCDDDNYYCATYMDIKGYVKRSEVQCVSGTPAMPFANNISFRIFIPGGVDLRSTPTQSEGLNSVVTLQFLETNLKYYGFINGEEAISYKSTEWYYCKYFKNGIAQSGYVYSAYCDLLSAIPENVETLEYIDEPKFEVINTSTDPDNSSELSTLPSTTQIIIIVAVCLPCIFIIYLLFKPTKITAKAMENADLKIKKSKRTKKKHNDYYEYDE